MPDRSPTDAAPDTSTLRTLVGKQDSPPLLLAGTPATNPESVFGVLAGAVLNSEAGGRYRLLEEIARGGMGVIFLARDLVLDRDVGVKTLLRPPAEGSTTVRRFIEEARITS